VERDKRTILIAAAATLMLLAAAAAFLWPCGPAGGPGAQGEADEARHRRRAQPEPGPVEPAVPRVPALWAAEVGPGREPAESEVLCAALQFRSVFGSASLNRERLLEMTRRAAERGAKLIALPEAAIPGYASGTEMDRVVWRRPDSGGDEASLEGHAETVPGPSTAAFGAISKEHRCYITVPVIEHDAAQNKYYNTLAVVGPDGDVVCHYRKLNPWTIAEYAWASEGDRGLGHFETPYGRIGVMICYDIHSVLQKLAGEKVDIVLYSVAWVDAHPETWFDERLPQKCRRDSVALVLANWTSVPRGRSGNGYGFSRIVSREGRVVSKARRVFGEEIVYGILPRGKAVPKATPSAP